MGAFLQVYMQDWTAMDTGINKDSFNQNSSYISGIAFFEITRKEGNLGQYTQFFENFYLKTFVSFDISTENLHNFQLNGF